VGQDEAIHHIVRAYQCYLTGLAAAGRPIANLLFLGPTGTGKTRAVEATAEALLGNPRAVLKIDCAEFQHSHEIAKLIGSPPGYLGHRETHPLLSQDAINQYHTDKVKISFVLFDEIEKANDALWNLLLGILDKATLTLGDNRRVDFSNAMIFMTSNLGASEMGSLVSPRLGFHGGSGCESMERLDQRISRYGARHLNRSIERLLVQPLSNLIASGQVHPLDCVRVAHNGSAQELDFFGEVHGCGDEESDRSLAAA
jgi:ATP-dependent Clp protease ATP-binding subunit ClpB